MSLQLQFANGKTSGENLEFVHYYHDENPAIPIEQVWKNSVPSQNFEGLMQIDERIPAFGTNKRMGLKRMLNFINKHNPITINLRNGILASLMLNKSNASEILRWSYINPNEAKQQGIELGKWKKLVEFRQKLEDVYFKAGGLKDSMKIAILEGIGNKDKRVSGFDKNKQPNPPSVNMDSWNDNSPLIELLGTPLYQSENSSQELIEPDTATCIETAKCFLSAISKQTIEIGTLFKETTEIKNNSKDDGFKALLNYLFDKDSKKEKDNPLNENELGKAMTNETKMKNLNTKTPPTKTENPINDKGTDTPTEMNEKPVSFYQQHKKLVVGAALGILGLAILGIGIHHHTKKHTTNTSIKSVKDHYKTNRNHQHQKKDIQLAALE